MHNTTFAVTQLCCTRSWFRLTTENFTLHTKNTQCDDMSYDKIKLTCYLGLSEYISENKVTDTRDYVGIKFGIWNFNSKKYYLF